MLEFEQYTQYTQQHAALLQQARSVVEQQPLVLLASIAAAVLMPALLSSLVASRREAAVAIKIPLPAAAQAGWKGTVLANPSIVDKSRPGKIVCYDPATGYHIDTIDADTTASIQAKIFAAKAAQAAWARTSWSARRKVLNTMNAWIVNSMEDIARVAARDTGKTAIDAAFGELLTTCSKLKWTVASGQGVLQDEVRPNNLLLAHKRCTVKHEPFGVVAACVSWNYPAHNLLSPLISSLFAGNAVVLKSSELVAWSSTYIIQGARECLRACGHSPELVQLVTCFPDAAEALTTSPDIGHLTFIGSEEVGRKVAVAASKELTPVTLELGGKDPAILLADADLKYFNSTFMRATFQAVGQNCIGIERFIVARSLVPRFLEVLEPRVKALQCGSFMDDAPFGASSSSGDPHQVDCGAMITDARFDTLEGLIADAVQRGAKLHVGGKRLAHPRWPAGHYFAPTLLSGVTRDMPIAQAELFAPVLLVLAFDDVDEAVALANSTRYGLGSSVFGGNRAECRAVGDRLRCGMVNINDFAVSYLNQALPFGGAKKSGYGRFAGPEGLLSVTSPKAVTEDRIFSYVRTGIPPPLDYPLAKPARSWDFVRSLVLFAYGSTGEKVKGIFGLAKAGLS